MLKSHLSWSQNGTKEHTWRCFWLLKVRHVNTAQITELGREDHACLSLGHLLLSFCLSVYFTIQMHTLHKICEKVLVMSLRLPTHFPFAWNTSVFKDNWAHCSKSVLNETHGDRAPNYHDPLLSRGFCIVICLLCDHSHEIKKRPNQLKFGQNYAWNSHKNYHNWRHEKENLPQS